ncbi:tetratricopeptide repeat protein [Marinicellulosiphila megalodicopiae]|uniref:tetratricopeptide repeat protein n=1 Tax=Marinicellulosiphila megalodicopiae TaxID=2724896 RepID=UPI003BAEB38A
MNNNIKMKSIFAVILLCVLWLSVLPAIAIERTVKPITAKALRNLSLAQQYIDEKNFESALKELHILEAGEARLNEHEIAMTHSLLGFIAYTNEDIPNAISHYHKVIQHAKSIPENLEYSTVFGLAQLYFAQKKFDGAVKFMRHWLRLTETESVQAQLLLAQSYYQLKKYKLGIAPIKEAIRINQIKDKPIDENWLLLLRVLYYENKQPDMAIKTMHDLIKLNSKKEYFIQLASLYGQQNEISKQLEIYDALYKDNRLDKESEIITYAMLLGNNQLPFYAGKVLEDSINNELIEKNYKNIVMAADQFAAAYETEKAIKFYKMNHQYFDETGKSAYFAGRLSSVLQNWEQAKEYLFMAINKGQLDREDQARIMLGVALMNLNEFDAARVEFLKAKEDNRSLKISNSWVKYLNSQQRHVESIEKYL